MLLADKVTAVTGTGAGVGRASALLFVRGGVPYGVTKAGVIQLTRALAIETPPLGLRVNGLCPGPSDTNFAVPPEAASRARSARCREVLGSQHPRGKPIEAEDGAKTALHLALKPSSNVTGLALPVDGGCLAR